jgi:hypothetical protein
MNITYILGNGFDKAIGLATGYPEFLKSYCEKKNNDSKYSELINAMKDDIKAHKNLWSDLEITLGKYTSNFDNYKDFYAVYKDLNHELKKYLLEQQKCIGKDVMVSKDIFVKRLSNFTSFLEIADAEMIRQYLSNYSSYALNIISLNYTNSVEQIFGLNKSTSPATLNLSGGYFLNSVEHLHGTLDGSIIMGVSEIAQIANEKLQKDSRIMDFLLKPQTCAITKNLVDRKCSGILDRTDLLILYGVSLGESDNYIWKKVGKLFQKLNFKMLLFYYNPDFNSDSDSWERKWEEDNIKSSFLKHAGLGEKDINNIENKIIIGFNKPIFNLKK